MRRAWLFFIVGLSGLASMRVAYDLTYEPPPSVRVRWRDFTTDARRAPPRLPLKRPASAARLSRGFASPHPLLESVPMLEERRHSVAPRAAGPPVPVPAGPPPMQVIFTASSVAWRP